MLIKEFSLTNFRNYKNLHFTPHEKLNIFLGDNAQGKSNLLEALFVLSLGKSYKAQKEMEIICQKEDFSQIKASIEENFQTKLVNILWTKEKFLIKKLIKLDGNTCRKISLFYGQVKSVMFSIFDLKIITEGPIWRRRFLDFLISQINPIYLKTLIQYYQYLKMKNSLLRSNNNLILIEALNEKLVDLGLIIILKRQEFIKKFTPIFYDYFSLFNKKKILLTYQANLSLNNNLKETYKKKLEKLLEEEIRKKFTLCGPHLDELNFSLDGFPIRLFGSLGEQHLTVLALKFAQAKLLFQETKTWPILILDDCISSLDLNHQKSIGNLILNAGQIFLAFTELPLFINKFSGNYYFIKQGVLSCY
ncbi:MAG: DNA replication and repair protein RecF [Armatimonadetes bacterium]|nr:DNA replication and repair protein RecF [Armatimonadota bacterium]